MVFSTGLLLHSNDRILVGGLFVERFVTEPLAFWTRQLLKEVTVETSRSYAAGDWDATIRLASRGDINSKALVTHRFPPDDALMAYEVADQKLEKSAKSFSRLERNTKRLWRKQNQIRP
jgi:threonine dehydrogenase-like Zn-dependent dehydrogenase